MPLVVIAAAGRAKRFAGAQKVLADVGGQPAIRRVTAACGQALGPHHQLIVVGYQSDGVRAALGEGRRRRYVVQDPQLGTGHALSLALSYLELVESRRVYFLCGDKPLLSPDSLTRLGEELDTSGAAMVFLTGSVQGELTANRQGRVVQAHPGTSQAEVLGIVERPTIDALGDQGALSFSSRTGRSWRYSQSDLLSVRDVNISAYVWREGPLRSHLGDLKLHPEKGEYYVTDLVEVLRAHWFLVRAIAVHNYLEGLGVDTPAQLAQVQEAWQHLHADTDPTDRSASNALLPTSDTA